MKKIIFMLLFLISGKLILAENETSSEKRDLEYKKDNFTYLISGGRRQPEKLAFVRYMVSIRSRRPQKYFGDNHFCAGTIISAKLVLTAAHCVMDKRKVLTRPRRLLIVAGSPNRLRIETTTRQISVKSIVAHDNYIMRNIDDIAIITLKTSLPVHGTQIQAMPLPINPPPYGVNCTTLGWGRMYYNGPLTAQALHVEVFLLSHEECKRFVPKLNLKGILCAGDRVLFNEDPCRGDSGGPLICEGVLTGIISWTIGCGSKKLPSLFTDVYAHLPWIMTNSKGHSLKATHLTSLAIITNLMYIFIN